MNRVYMISSLTVGAVLFAGSAQADWGAIAYSPATDHGGYAVFQHSKSVAEDLALEVCERLSNANDCIGVLSFEDAWGAIATTRHGNHGVGTGTTAKKAARVALQNCSLSATGCRLMLNVFSNLPRGWAAREATGGF